MPKVTFVERNGNLREIEARVGQTLLEIAWDNDLDVEGACEGSMACATCHVIVDPAWFDRLPDPSEDEEDMLDLAYDIQKTSRLGCQITLTDALDGLVVRLPKDVRNMLL
ncbi:MAG: ferredoxin family 2Fe-2S iron-sulfur cluster binding protein [Rhodospirillaceae bacterium]|nr:ferredoxin family 2Fe-2S iron-sulfur cluster binding protein [Rhodospirillaceae bacterium]